MKSDASRGDRTNANPRAPSRRSSDELLERAAQVRALARVFGTPFGGRIAEARRVWNDCAWTRSAIDQAWRGSNEELCAAYTALFLSPQGVPLREAAYGSETLTGRAIQVADVEGFYRMFGFPRIDNDAEPADHIAVELDFLGWLLAKEAYARTRGLSAQVRASQLAAGVFLNQHLARWTPAFVRRLRSLSVDTPYGQFGELLLAVVARESRRHANSRPRSDADQRAEATHRSSPS